MSPTTSATVTVARDVPLTTRVVPMVDPSFNKKVMGTVTSLGFGFSMVMYSRNSCVGDLPV